MRITIGVEDLVSETVARRLIEDYCPGASIVRTIGLKGKNHLRQNIRALNQIALYQGPALVLTDLDQPCGCAPTLVHNWISGLTVSSNLLMRVVVMEIESWLLADRTGISNWLSIPISRLPYDPEKIGDAKRTLVELAHRSRHRNLREAIVPRRGIGTHAVGPGYNSAVSEFATTIWSPDQSRRHAQSLDRTINRLIGLPTL
jgi:hypothetical protein